jgi:polyhydroxyalkanoate synthesis regulator phasin
MFCALLLFPGCALLHTHPEEYVQATNDAVELVAALEANVARIADNNVALVIADTDKLVEAGEMTAEEAKKAVDIIREQSETVKAQAQFIHGYVRMAKTDVDGDEPDLNALADALEDLAKILPQLKNLLDQLRNTG